MAKEVVGLGRPNFWVGPTMGWANYFLSAIHLVEPHPKRPLWSVRHAQLAGHEIVLGAKLGLLLQGNPRYLVPLINCP